MNFLDRFFKKYPIIILIQVESPRVETLKTNFLHKMKIIEHTNNSVILQFDHADMDGVTVIQNLLFADEQKKNNSIALHHHPLGDSKQEEGFKNEQKCCLDFDDFLKYAPNFSFVSTMNHLRLTFKAPFLQYPNSTLECFSKELSLSKLQELYCKFKEKTPKLKFSTFLCAVQCKIFQECTGASFLKLQILPKIK